MQYGILCLLPPAAMLIFALKTKKSFEALIFGTLVAYLIMYKTAFIGPWCDLLLSEISNADNQYILLLCGLFGGFIFLLREAKGTLGFSNLLSRFCKDERITMMMSVFLGIIISDTNLSLNSNTLFIISFSSSCIVTFSSPTSTIILISSSVTLSSSSPVTPNNFDIMFVENVKNFTNGAVIIDIVFIIPMLANDTFS